MLDARLIDRWQLMPPCLLLLQLSCFFNLFEALAKTGIALLVKLNKKKNCIERRWEVCALTASALIKNMSRWEQRKVQSKPSLKDSHLSFSAGKELQFFQPPKSLWGCSACLGSWNQLSGKQHRGKIGSDCSDFKDGFRQSQWVFVKTNHASLHARSPWAFTISVVLEIQNSKPWIYSCSLTTRRKLLTPVLRTSRPQC